MEIQPIKIFESYLQDFTIESLKKFCQNLQLDFSGNRFEVITRLFSYYSSKSKSEDPSTLLWQLCSNQQCGIPRLNCICKQNISHLQLIQCSLCRSFQHKQCIKNLNLFPYECFNCRLLQINPLEEIIEFLIPSFLCENGMSRSPSFVKKFEYPEELRRTVQLGNGDLQIQVRCINLEGDPYAQQWPLVGCLIINDKIAMQFQAPNPNAKKRKDQPLNITTLLRSDSPNNICLLQDTNMKTERFVCSVALIQKKSEASLIEEIKSHEGLSVEESRAFINKILLQGDSDIVSNSIKFSIKCPITMTLVEIPVRGARCTHIPCFNLGPYIYLQKSSRVNRWKCPICKKPANKMIVDRFVEQMITEARTVENASQIELFSNGTFYIILEEINNSDSEQSDEEEIRKRRKLKEEEKVAETSKMDKENSSRPKPEKKDSKKEPEIIEISD